MKTYTINEIFRLKLLKNHKGEPYNNKGTVSRVVQKLAFKKKRTPWGMSKYLTESQIESFNKRNRYADPP